MMQSQNLRFWGAGLLCLWLVLAPCSWADGDGTQADDADAAAVASAHQVMEEFLRAFNARDKEAWADTLLFPHVRVASGGLSVIADRDTFVSAMDMDEFARTFDWAHSEWDAIELIQAGPDKVHFKVQFSRFNPQGERNATFDSLYIIQRVDGRWGVRARSSFAP
jgi:hypothetical protein